MKPTDQMLARVDARCRELNLHVIEAVASPDCPCGFDHARYRQVLQWHATECIKQHRSAKRMERHGTNSEYATAVAMRMESAAILTELKPCPRCKAKYNPTGRHRATLPDLRDPSDFLSKGELYDGIANT